MGGRDATKQRTKKAEPGKGWKASYLERRTSALVYLGTWVLVYLRDILWGVP